MKISYLKHRLKNMPQGYYWVEPREITYPLRRVMQPAIDPEEYRSLIRFAIETNIDDIIL